MYSAALFLALALALVIAPTATRAQDDYDYGNIHLCSTRKTEKDCSRASEACGWCSTLMLCTQWDVCAHRPTFHHHRKERECSQSGGEWTVYKNGASSCIEQRIIEVVFLTVFGCLVLFGAIGCVTGFVGEAYKAVQSYKNSPGAYDEIP
jgi:hypothetical protein